MAKKKIVWLSNFRFSNSASSGSGGWIESMGKGLVATGEYEICNITLGPSSSVSSLDACGIRQWIVPVKPTIKKPMYALPPRGIVEGINRVVDEVSPDLIHVWGTERFWGLLTARKILDYPALLEMQGVTSAMTPYMTGCLTKREIRSCFGLKEALRPWLSLEWQQRRFAESKVVEEEIIAGHRFIDYQSDWVKAYMTPYVSDARTFKTRMTLRADYLKSTPWRFQNANHVVFTSCGWAANKGLHVLVRACLMLKKKYPDIQLRIAGGIGKGLREGGYERWMRKEMQGRIDFVALGALTALQMIKEMRSAAVFVNPSLVESYSLSLAEAMAVGCPCIASYAGAMPEVGGRACLYFPIADPGVLAQRIEHVFESGSGVADMAVLARAKSLADHSLHAAVERQKEIYEEVLSNV